MQGKGIIKFFAILLAVVCLYQLSFTWVAMKVENDASNYAKGNLLKEKAYLDSMDTQPVYPLLGWKYQYVKDKKLALGLDLKGGMHVTLEISPVEIITALSGNNADPAFRLAGLPAPVPDDLPGPPAAGQGPAVGAQQPRRERAQCAGRLVAAAARPADRGGRGRSARPGLDHRGLRRPAAVGQVPALGPEKGGGLRDRAGPGQRAGRRGAHGGDQDRSDRGIRADRPAGRPARAGGIRRARSGGL